VSQLKAGAQGRGLVRMDVGDGTAKTFWLFSGLVNLISKNMAKDHTPPGNIGKGIKVALYKRNLKLIKYQNFLALPFNVLFLYLEVNFSTIFLQYNLKEYFHINRNIRWFHTVGHCSSFTIFKCM